ncbi:MAG: TonB-dependent receptor, partial [bacterium]
LNAYFMDYIDQLVLTGQINDVGSYTRTNIDRSYRTGIELEGGFRISDHFAVEGNATFNENRIRKYTEYTDAYDADFNYIGQEPKTFSGAPIAFSPALTSTLQFTYKPRKNLDFRLIG